ncbi:protein FAM199X-B-like [Actinia tenebrosa]|uniref:Protein FAM199X-B-like n=1 Tax=Actinia tenebrosa TaxID=6105 RepID=A0A6P8HDC2_ACTTE|nr:protein FAM199X-B-like [Actinia tenebrosa]
MLAFENDPCETRMLGTSPIFSKDYFVNSFADFCPLYSEDDIAAEVNVQCESISANSSCGTSVTSEFSEDSFFDNDDEEFLPLGESECAAFNFEPLEQFSNVMQGNSDLEDEEVLSFNNKGEFDSKKRKSSIKSECGCCELRKRMAGLSWNKMSSSNQMESIEYLTKVVSSTLGLREQLDVIRIISPEATVSATDTEFFIDLETFNDDKFQRLKQYINEHLLDDECKKCSESRKKRCQYKTTSSPQQKFSSKRKTQKPLSTKRVSKKSRKSKGLLSRIHRQMEKEKRSGLFDREEVLSVSRKPSLSECEEEIEVDILC